MPKDALQSASQRLSLRSASKLTLRWQVIDGLADRLRRHPLLEYPQVRGLDEARS
jgi:hypothetical protein